MREVQNYLVRIFNKQNIPVGCGFLVGTGKRHIATCCHVINDALERSDRTSPHETVQIDFPFLATKKLFKAEITHWHYEPDDQLNDIAVLTLLESAPEQAIPAPLIDNVDYSGDTFRAFGFPRGFEDNGREVKGILGAKQVNGCVLAEGVSQLGYFIEGGFSGTPIWNSTKFGVCGMAFQVDTPNEVKVASFIPTELLLKATPDITDIQVTEKNSPEVERYLHYLISDLENRMGVLQYVDLAGSTHESQPQFPFSVEEFGFSEIIQKSNKTHAKEIIPLGSIRNALEKHDRFVLVGDAGGSKTTTIRRLAMDMAFQKLLNPNNPLPLIFSLPRWRDENTAEDFILSQWRELKMPESLDPLLLLASGDAILFLDGLNEMGGDGSDKAKKLKMWLQSTKAPKCIIITCRKNNYVGDFDLDLPVVQIEPLSDAQIRQFAQNYLGDKADTFLERIMPSDERSKKDTHHLYHLAQNPYMLAALIIVFNTSSERELPRNNGRLFQSLAIALARRESQRNSQGWHPFENRFRTIEIELSLLAFDMIEDSKGTEITVEYASNFLSNLTIEAALSAKYIEKHNNNIRFIHHLLQEYFAAIQLKECEEGKIREIVSLEYYQYYENRIPSKWDPIVVSLLGLGEARFIDFMIDVNCYLVAQAVQTGVSVSEEQRNSIVNKLVNEAENYLYSAQYSGMIQYDPYFFSMGLQEINNLLKIFDSEHLISHTWDNIP